MNPIHHRQGDLLFIRFTGKAPMKAKENPLGRVLALGEATGHSHAVEEPDLANADVYLDAQGRLVVRVKRGESATVRHEEHGAVELDGGTWEVRRQREYQPSGWTQVAD